MNNKTHMQKYRHWIEITYLESNIVYMAVQGSQNYGLDYDNSDLDTKAITLPSLSDIALNKRLKSYTHVRQNNEHIDVKDIRIMFECFKKQNINFLEILFSPYYVIHHQFQDIFLELRAIREEIAVLDMNKRMNSMAGMAYEKFKAMEHPYPTILDKIKRYRYDPKQLHHILRMEYFIEDTLAGKSFEESLYPRSEVREFLMEAKLGVFNLDDARVYAQNALDHIDNMKERWREENSDYRPNEETKEKIDRLLVRAIKRGLRNEILERDSLKG